jgi:cell division protease FtsH
MFSIGRNLVAPPVQELPEVLIKPNQSLAAFEDNEGNYGDAQIIQNQDLWQTIAESDANVRIDMTAQTSISDTISVFFLLTFIFFCFSNHVGWSKWIGAYE